MPSANHFDLKRPTLERTGCFQSTSGAAQAPRCFKRKPRFVASAHAHARIIPICTVIPVEGGGPPPLFGLSVRLPAGLRVRYAVLPYLPRNYPRGGFPLVGKQHTALKKREKIATNVQSSSWTWTVSCRCSASTPTAPSRGRSTRSTASSTASETRPGGALLGSRTSSSSYGPRGGRRRPTTASSISWECPASCLF